MESGMIISAIVAIILTTISIVSFYAMADNYEEKINTQQVKVNGELAFNSTGSPLNETISEDSIWILMVIPGSMFAFFGVIAWIFVALFLHDEFF